MDKEVSQAAKAMGKKRWAGTTPEQRSAYCSKIARKITPEMAKVRTEKAVASRRFNRAKKIKTDWKWLPDGKPKAKRAPKKQCPFVGRRALIFTKVTGSDWMPAGESLIDRYGKLALSPAGLDAKQLEMIETWIGQGMTKIEKTQGGMGLKLTIN